MESRVDVLRGTLVESRHRVSVAVADPDGVLVAHCGDVTTPTFWRSAAKFFQAIPLVAGGGADALGVDEEELALACASHNGEARHVAVATRLLARSGATVADLACGAHASLNAEVARTVAAAGAPLTRLHSNCSGKHAAMLAFAHHEGWPRDGYERPGHPAQERILDEVAGWSGQERGTIVRATDGCTAATFALPLTAMATAYARLGAAASGEPLALPGASVAAARRLVAAVRAHPFLIAGTGRLDSDLLLATGGAVIAKVGAEGVYCAAVPSLRLGLALKAEDGATRAQAPALLAVLEALAPGLVPAMPGWREPPLRNTVGTVVGRLVGRVELDRAAVIG